VPFDISRVSRVTRPYRIRISVSVRVRFWVRVRVWLLFDCTSHTIANSRCFRSREQSSRTPSLQVSTLVAI